MLITSRYVGIEKGKLNYLFFLLTEDYITAHKVMSGELTPLLKKFARDLDATGTIVIPSDGDERETRDNILHKEWSWSERGKLEETPGILVINVDFDEFNPRLHPWLHFSIRDSMNEYGNIKVFELQQLLNELALSCRIGEDLFSVMRREFKKKEVRQRTKELYDALEFEILGLSFDVRKGIAFLRSLRSSQ